MGVAVAAARAAAEFEYLAGVGTGGFHSKQRRDRGEAVGMGLNKGEVGVRNGVVGRDRPNHDEPREELVNLARA